MWFRKNIELDMIRMLNPTSKASLKQQCMILANGDVKKAKEIYDFYTDGLKSLPDFDPVKPSSLDNLKDNVVGLMGWLKDNQSTVASSVDLIRGLISRGAVNAAEDVVEELPPIND